MVVVAPRTRETYVIRGAFFEAPGTDLFSQEVTILMGQEATTLSKVHAP